MTVEEKVAIQNLIIGRLQADAAEHPTALLDALLSGDGQALVFSIVAQEEAQARQRLEILMRLLGSLKAGAFLRNATPGPPAPPTMPYLTPVTPEGGR